MPLTDGKDQVGRVGHSTHNHELQQRSNGHSPSFPGMRPCVPLELQAGLAQAGISANHLAVQSSQAALHSGNYAQSIAQAAQSAMQAGLLGSHTAQPIGMPWLPLTVPALSMPVHHPVSYLPFHPGAPPNALAPPPYFVTPQTHQLNAMSGAAAATASATHAGASSSAANSQQPYGPAFNLPVVPSVFMLNQYLQYLFAAQHAASQAQPPLANSSPLGSASSSSSIAPSQLSPKSSCATQNAPASSGVPTGTKHSVTTSTPSHACSPQPTVTTFNTAPTPAATPTPAPNAAVFMPSFAFSHKPSGSVIPVGIAAQVRPSGTPQSNTTSSTQSTLVGVPISPQPTPANGQNSATATILVPASTGSMPTSNSGSPSSASANATAPAGYSLPTAFMPNATVYFAMPSTVQPSQFSTGTSSATQLPLVTASQSDSSNSTTAQPNASGGDSASTPQAQSEPAVSAMELEQPRVVSEERLAKKRERLAAASRKIAPVPPVELQPVNVPDSDSDQLPAPTSTSTSASVSDKLQEQEQEQEQEPVRDAVATSTGDARRRRKRAKSRTKRMRFSPARRGAKRRRMLRESESVPREDQNESAGTARAELPAVSKQQQAAAAKQRKRDRDRERRRVKAAARQRELVSPSANTENNNELKTNHNETDVNLRADSQHQIAERCGAVENEHEAERFLVADSELIGCENSPVLHFDAATNTYVEVRLTEMVPANLYEMRVLGDRSTQQHILTHEEVLDYCVHDYRLDLTSVSASAAERKTLPGSAEQSLAVEQLLTARYANARIAARWHYAENRFYAGRVRRITAKRGRLPLANTMEIEVEFDDGDTGVIEPDHVRLVPSVQPPLLRTAGLPPRRATERDLGTDSLSTAPTRARMDFKTSRVAPSDGESLSKTEGNERSFGFKIESPETALLGATTSKRRASVRTKTATVENSDTQRKNTPIPFKRQRGKAKDEPAASPKSEIKAFKKTELADSDQQQTTESSELLAARRVTRQRSGEAVITIKTAAVAPAEGGKTSSNSPARGAAKRTASGSNVVRQRTVEFLRVGDCVQFHTDSASALSLSGRRRRAPSSGGTSSQLPFIGRIVAIYALKQLASEPEDSGSRTPFSSMPSSLSGANSTTLFGADSSTPLSSSSCAVFGTCTPSSSSVVKLRKVSVRRAPLPVGVTTGTGTGTVGLVQGAGLRDDSVTRNSSGGNASQSQPTGDGGTQQPSGHEVHVRWFYHPQEVAIPVHATVLGNKHALFESNHRDRNDVATVAHRVAVRTYTDFANVKPEVATAADSYFVAGYYDPIKHILAYADDVRERLIKS